MGKLRSTLMMTALRRAIAMVLVTVLVTPAQALTLCQCDDGSQTKAEAASSCCAVEKPVRPCCAKPSESETECQSSKSSCCEGAAGPCTCEGCPTNRPADSLAPTPQSVVKVASTFISTTPYESDTHAASCRSLFTWRLDRLSDREPSLSTLLCVWII